MCESYFWEVEMIVERYTLPEFQFLDFFQKLFHIL